MKTERNILIAFALNFCFSIFEFVGGILTNSIAIASDAIHDFGDALSIGIAYVLEKKSHKKPDSTHTFGYTRYFVLGGLITSAILLFGSILVIYRAIARICSPAEINYSGMIIFAIVGFAVNLLAAYFTSDGGNINQKSVNLHMLEDVLGWLIVLVGALTMKYTNFSILDSIMSIAVSMFILINALKNLKEILDLFLEKVPKNISVDEIIHHLKEIESVEDVHRVHIWSVDGINNFATLHVVSNDNPCAIKKLIREELQEHGIANATIEIEKTSDACGEPECALSFEQHKHHHHHHH